MEEYDYVWNCTPHLLEDKFGIYLPVSTLVPTTIAYILIFTFGVVGNILVAYVIWRNSDMRSSTNYYLLNLSIADMLVLIICMPVALIETYILEHWMLGEAICTLVSFMENTCAQATILTHVAISIERYNVICKPLKANYRCTTRRTVIMCSVVWLVALISSIPHIVLSKHTPCVDSTGDIRYTCGFSFDNVYFSTAYFIVVPILFFFCPVVFLSAIYAKVGLTLRRHDEFIASMREQSFKERPKSYANECNPGKDTREMAAFLGFRMMGICSVDSYASGNNAPNAGRRLSREKLIRDEAHQANTKPNGNNVKFNGFRKNSVCNDIETLPEYPSDETCYSERRCSQISVNAPTVKASPESSSFFARLPRPGVCKTSSNASYQRQHHIRIVFMLICVVISFFICWLPFRMLNLWILIGPTTILPAVGISGYYGLVIFSRVMVYLNSAINPILYNAISSKFRASFRTVCCGKPRNNRRQSRNFRSTSSYPSNPPSRRSQVDQV